jgi:membrane protein required for colicin V production
MNWLDLVLILILGVSVLTSLRKGLSREVIGLVSVVAALLLAVWLYGTAGSLVAPYVSSPSVAHFIGFALIFVGVLLLGGVISYVVGRFLKVTGLSIFDHLLGAVFGLVRGVLIGVALVMGIMAFSGASGPPGSVVHSRVAPYVVDAARVVAAMAPHEVREGFRKTYAEVKSAWGKTLEDGFRKLPSPEKKEHERKI